MSNQKPIDRETALQLAQTWFSKKAAESPDMSFSAVDETKIVEAAFAWILPWNDRRYFAGDGRFYRVGQLPLVVLKSDGTMMYLPALTPSEVVRWKSTKLHGNIEHRIANLAEKLGITNP